MVIICRLSIDLALKILSILHTGHMHVLCVILRIEIIPESSVKSPMFLMEMLRLIFVNLLLFNITRISIDF